MGSNQQRQAVPLIQTQSPLVGTGLEGDAARNTGQLITAKADGEVIRQPPKKLSSNTKMATLPISRSTLSAVTRVVASTSALLSVLATR